MSYARRALAVAWKALAVARRSKETLNALVFCSLLLLFVFQFPLGGARERLAAVLPGVLWLGFVLSALLALGRTFLVEREHDCWEGLLLAPGDKSAIYLGKLAGNLALMLVVEALVLGLFAVFFDIDLGRALPEVTQGNVQRIMYVHVPLILASYLAFVVLALASLVYLVRRDEAADRVAHASGEVGVMFVGLGIATGSIWGKPTWGTWWTWDARLTSVAILFVMYLGYLLLRGTIEDRERAARYCAVVGIVAALDIPLVHFSVYWWRTLHQPPSLMKPGGFTGSTSILWPLLINLLAFVLLYTYLVARRVSLLRAEAEAAAWCPTTGAS